MLDASTQKVETIVNDTRRGVESLVAEGKGKIDKGTEVAQSCAQALERILGTVQLVDRMVEEISTASTEQSKGIGEINKAMGQLNQATAQNSTVSQQCATASEQLNVQARDLKGMVDALNMLLRGAGAHVDAGNAGTPAPVVQLRRDRGAESNAA